VIECGLDQPQYLLAGQRLLRLRPDLEWDQDQEFLDLDGKKIEKRQKDHISNELFKI
jgi:hypothetical protein